MPKSHVMCVFVYFHNSLFCNRNLEPVHLARTAITSSSSWRISSKNHLKPEDFCGTHVSLSKVVVFGLIQVSGASTFLNEQKAKKASSELPSLGSIQ